MSLYIPVSPSVCFHVFMFTSHPSVLQTSTRILAQSWNSVGLAVFIHTMVGLSLPWLSCLSQQGFHSECSVLCSLKSDQVGSFRVCWNNVGDLFQLEELGQVFHPYTFSAAEYPSQMLTILFKITVRLTSEEIPCTGQSKVML